MRKGIVAISTAARREVGLFVVVLFWTVGLRQRGMAVERGGKIEREDGIAALGGAILHDVFPVFLVVVFLRLAPGLAGGEVDRLRSLGPGKCVDILVSLGHGEGFAAVGGDEVDLAGGVRLCLWNRQSESESPAFSAELLRSERNAIQRPSGDHLGSESCPDCVN